jgi:nitrate/nitrite transporter NarK
MQYDEEHKIIVAESAEGGEQGEKE